MRDPHSHINESDDPRVNLLEIGGCRQYRWTFQSIRSFHWKYYWNPNGKGSFTLGEQSYNLTRDQAVLISPGTHFEPDQSQEMDHFFLHFSYAGPAAPIYRKAAFPVSPQPRQAQKVYETVIKGEGVALQERQICLSLIYGALAELADIAIEREVSDSRIAEWIQIINLAPEKAPSNFEYADSIGLHSQSAIRLFKNQTGVTPKQYVLQRRLEKACLLLSQRNLSQDEIAYQSGFGDRRYLWRIFNRHVGMSPVAYQKSLRNQKVFNLQTLLTTHTT